MSAVHISQHNGQNFNVEIPLASSKSESNRALIINALGGFRSSLQNLSSARDTQTMIRLLASTDKEIDVLDAGTTMRFLTAYFAVSNQNKIMTGTARMCERPIALLVDALRAIGAEISYLKEEGYPPLELHQFKEQTADQVSIKANVSSQYISALLMIGAFLPKGLTINLEGEIGSKPYIEMTIAQLKAFGIDVETDWTKQCLKINHQHFGQNDFMVESDWSGASYWFTVCALAKDPATQIHLLGLKEQSLQGDSAIVDIMKNFGVKTVFNASGALLTKTESCSSFEYDYTSCPDLVQTVVACAAALKVEIKLTGIESLKIKETDRVLALQNEIAKVGASLVEIENNHLYGVKIDHSFVYTKIPRFSTYDDHRMAMAFAPLAMAMDVVIEEPNVVAKSYPTYWDHISKILSVKPL